jgi:hypothetical protein
MDIFLSKFLSKIIKNNSKNAGVLFDDISHEKPMSHSDMTRGFTPCDEMQTSFLSNFLSNIIKNNSKK